MNLLKTAAPAAFQFAWTEDGKQTGACLEIGTGRSCQNWTLDCERVLRKGVRGIRGELEGMQAALMPTDSRHAQKAGLHPSRTSDL